MTPQQQPQPSSEGPDQHGLAGGGPGAGLGLHATLAASAAAAGTNTGAGVRSTQLSFGLGELNTIGPIAHELDSGAHMDAAGTDADAVDGSDTDGTSVRAAAFGLLPASGAGGGEAVTLQCGGERPSAGAAGAAAAEAPWGPGLPRTPRRDGQYGRRQGGPEVGPHAEGGDQGAHDKHGQAWQQHLGRRVRESDDADGAGPSTGALGKRQRRCSLEGEQVDEARSGGKERG